MNLSIRSQINTNKQKTLWLLVFFIVFITTAGYLFGHLFAGSSLSLAGIALIISGLFSFFSYYYSDSLVLKLSQAKGIQDSKHPLVVFVANLCYKAKIPPPKVYLMPGEAINAFATGRDPKHSAICLTEGALKKLEKTELEGVIAHELSHIKNFDTRLMSIVAILVGMISIIADMFLQNIYYWSGANNRGRRDQQIGGLLIIFGIILALLSPLVASLVQLAISRKREFLADASAALITDKPQGLALALEKIADDKESLPQTYNATAHLFIANPFKQKNLLSNISHLFNTHPPITERIRALRSM